MRRITAYGGLAILVLATLYAPMVHIHGDDDSGVWVVHAHLPQSEISEAETGVHVESHHSHSGARSFDLFTATPQVAVYYDPVVASSPWTLRPRQTCCGFVSIDMPRIHAPPGAQSPTSRAPPSA